MTTAGGTTADTATDDFTYTTAPPVTRYDQTNTNIVKTGTWANYSEPRLLRRQLRPLEPPPAPRPPSGSPAPGSTGSP